MTDYRLKYLFRLVLTLGLIMGVRTVMAYESSGYVQVDGITAYYAIVPAELIRGHAKEHSEATMHGGVPSGKHVHHLMIALFEGKNLERIVDAKVKASMVEIGLAGQPKKLDPFTVADALTYGNYFRLTANTEYRVTVTVERPDSPGLVKFSFNYHHN